MGEAPPQAVVGVRCPFRESTRVAGERVKTPLSPKGDISPIRGDKKMRPPFVAKGDTFPKRGDKKMRPSSVAKGRHLPPWMGEGFNFK